MKRKVGGVGQNLEFFGCLKLKKFVKPWDRRLCWLYSCNHLSYFEGNVLPFYLRIFSSIRMCAFLLLAVLNILFY